MRDDNVLSRWRRPQAEESNEDRSDDLCLGPRQLPGARPGADPDLRAGRPEPRHGHALWHWQRPVSRLARAHQLHDDDDERCDADLRLQRPPHGHRHRIASPLMATIPNGITSSRIGTRDMTRNRFPKAVREM